MLKTEKMITSSLSVRSIFFLRICFGHTDLTLLFSKPNFSYFLLQTARQKKAQS